MQARGRLLSWFETTVSVGEQVKSALLWYSVDN